MLQQLHADAASAGRSVANGSQPAMMPVCAVVQKDDESPDVVALQDRMQSEQGQTRLRRYGL